MLMRMRMRMRMRMPTAHARSPCPLRWRRAHRLVERRMEVCQGREELAARPITEAARPIAETSPPRGWRLRH